MRILYIHNINQVAETYSNKLTGRGHTVTIYQPDLTGAGASLPAKLALMPRRIVNLQQIVGELNNNRFDLVHIHWASYGILGLISSIPYIVECHGTDVRYRLNNPFFRPILASILRRARAILCITPDLLAPVRSVRPDAIFLPGPVNTDLFIPQPDPPHPPTILLFTRLDRIKGSEIAIQGILLFIRQYPKVHVRLFDWGELKDHYKRLYGDRFEFIPCVPPEEVPELIRSADIVLGQFNLGILSFAELQAMSCAKPVITFFNYQDAYPTPPPLFQASSPQEIAEQLEYLFSHPDVAQEVGIRAREWVIAQHSRQMLAERLEQLYLSILKQK